MSQHYTAIERIDFFGSARERVIALIDQAEIGTRK